MRSARGYPARLGHYTAPVVSRSLAQLRCQLSSYKKAHSKRAAFSGRPLATSLQRFMQPAVIDQHGEPRPHFICRKPALCDMLDASDGAGLGCRHCREQGRERRFFREFEHPEVLEFGRFGFIRLGGFGEGRYAVSAPGFHEGVIGPPVTLYGAQDRIDDGRPTGSHASRLASQLATRHFSFGRKARLRGSPREGPECAP